MGKGAALQPTQARMGAALFPSGEFRALPLLNWFLWGLLDRLFSGGGSRHSHHTRGFSPFKWAGWHPLWGSYTFQDFSVWKGEVTLHLLPQLFHTFGQLAWLPLSRQIRLLHPVLEGMGICYFLLPLCLSDVLRSEDSIWRQLEPLSKEAQWGRGCFTMVLCLFHLTGSLWVTEKSSYLSC